MKKLFYLLLALPMLMVACEDTPEPAPAPEKDAVLTLTSEAEMVFEAEGEGVITYTLENAPEGALPTATCEAEWICNLTVAEAITFTVEYPETSLSEADETKIKVAYEEQSFEVTVKRMANFAYTMDVKLAAAARIPSAELGLENNVFALIFVDDAENIELGFVLTGAEGDTVLKAGKYDAEEAEMYTYEPEAEYTFASGAVTVAVEEEEFYTFDITLIDDTEGVYHFTYEGVVMDMEPTEVPEPENFEPVNVVARRSSTWALGNFELQLYINESLYHALDMQDNTNPNEFYLTEGTYSYTDGSITDWSNIVIDTTTGEGAYINDAEIELTHNADGTSTIKGYFESEYGDVFNIDWTGVVSGFNFTGETPDQEPVGDVNFTATYFGGGFYEANADYGTDHNFYLCLSDMEINTDIYVPNATSYFLDLYAATDGGENHVAPNGTYTFDMTNSCVAGTCGEGYTFGYKADAEGNPTFFVFIEGSVTVSDNRIEAVLKTEDGYTHTIVYEGNLALISKDSGEDTGDDEIINYFSTLTSDLVLDGTNYTCYATYYGDWYSADTDNWWVTIYEDGETGSGKYIQLDLLADYYADNWGLQYKPWGIGSLVNTYIPGEIYDGSLSGCWYAELTEGRITGQMAPIFNGTIDVTFNDDGSKTFTFDCVDDAGHKITGSVTSTPTASTYAAKKVNAQNGQKTTIKLPSMSKVVRR